MYGYQPFYMYQSANGLSASAPSFVGVFDLNAYATDYILNMNQGVKSEITKIVIGGTIQKFFFTANKPDLIIKKYQALVGMPTVPPLWAFGWQQCRFGYKTDSDWWSVI